MARERKLERTDIETFREGMREQGYSPETIKIAEEEVERIEPGQDHLELENVILIAVMPDDSGSIGGQNPLQRNNTQDVIDGHNNIVEALKDSEQARMILFKTQYLNSDTPLNNWVPLHKVVLMTRDNFKPAGTTPLYDKALSLLTSVIYEKTEAIKRGHSHVRWGVLLITDGDDYGSKNPASKVKTILDDMKKNGEIMESCKPEDIDSGSIALLGVEDRKSDPEASPHFEQIAHSMGINWVIYADKTDPTEMRRAFNTFSNLQAETAQ